MKLKDAWENVKLLSKNVYLHFLSIDALKTAKMNTILLKLSEYPISCESIALIPFMPLNYINPLSAYRLSLKIKGLKD